eukprot:tig00000681_g3099.t1
MARGFVFRTTQVQAVKSLVEAVKDIVTEVNMTFGEEGVRVAAMDSAHVCLVYVSLPKDNIEEYTCVGNHVLGLNMMNLHAIIKTVAVNEVLTLAYDPATPELEIRIRNEDKNIDKVYSLCLMDIDEEQLEIPEREFEFVINMNAVDFQHNIRDMKSIADAVTIECNSRGVVFRAGEPRQAGGGGRGSGGGRRAKEVPKSSLLSVF